MKVILSPSFSSAEVRFELLPGNVLRINDQEVDLDTYSVETHGAVAYLTSYRDDTLILARPYTGPAPDVKTFMVNTPQVLFDNRS